MSPELAARILPIFVGSVAVLVTAGALIAADFKLAAAGAVCLVLAIVVNAVVRIQGQDDRQDPPDDCY